MLRKSTRARASTAVLALATLGAAAFSPPASAGRMILHAEFAQSPLRAGAPVMINPQPLPPRPDTKVMINPQPLPPRPQTKVTINPQPLPPKVGTSAWEMR
ncbi:MAG TPA: hypothetical protein VKX28_03840 [Xanthobacteraceae bacterium]|nr:hypothetical protein [Xanthobacteraceae bacterium]